MVASLLPSSAVTFDACFPIYGTTIYNEFFGDRLQYNVKATVVKGKGDTDNTFDLEYLSFIILFWLYFFSLAFLFPLFFIFLYILFNFISSNFKYWNKDRKLRFALFVFFLVPFSLLFISFSFFSLSLSLSLCLFFFFFSWFNFARFV